jgi:hypothetical protein
MKFLNKSTGVTVNDDKSAEKGLGYYEEHEAVIFTPNADLDLTARVKITNKDFGFFEIRMIIIFAEIGGNIKACSSPLARLPNLSFESMPPSSDELFDWLES